MNDAVAWCSALTLCPRAIVALALASGCATGGEPGDPPGPLTLGSGDQGSDDSGDETASSASSTTTTGADASSGADTTAGVTSDDTVGNDTTGGGPPSVILQCDTGWSFDPELPVAGQPLWVGFTDSVGHVDIGLDVQGPGLTMFTDSGIDGEVPAVTWWWVVEGIGPGVWTTVFESQGMVVAQCQFEVF